MAGHWADDHHRFDLPCTDKLHMFLWVDPLQTPRKLSILWNMSELYTKYREMDLSAYVVVAWKMAKKQTMIPEIHENRYWYLRTAQVLKEATPSRMATHWSRLEAWILHNKTSANRHDKPPQPIDHTLRTVHVIGLPNRSTTLDARDVQDDARLVAFCRYWWHLLLSHTAVPS